MKRLRGFRHLLSASVFAIQSVVLFFVMRLDPDPHHDGVLYGAAVSVLNGGVPNRDAFAQYGPLVPGLQGMWLKIFGPSLLNIRLQAVLIILLCSLIIWIVARNYLSNLSSLILSTTWAFTIPAVLPWPTLYTTALILVSLLLLLDIKEHRVRENFAYVFFSGSLIAIGIFARIHLIAVFLALIIFFLLSNRYRKHGIMFLSGFLAAISICLSFLHINGALQSFITQSITWPLFAYASPNISKSYIVGMMWYPATAITFLAFLFLIVRASQSRVKHRSLFLITAGVFVLLLLASKIDRVGYLSLNNPRVLLIDFARNMLNSLDYTAAMIMFVSAIIFLAKRKRFSGSQKIVTFASIGTATQLYPLYDVNHLWMISPVFIFSSLVMFGDSRGFKRVRSGLDVLLVGLLIALAVQLALFIRIERAPLQSPSLTGMYAPRDFAFSLDSTMTLLEKEVTPGSTSFNCMNGIYAGAGGKYLASSQQFVDWGPDSKLAETGNLMFVCAIDSKKLQFYYRSGYVAIFKNPHIFFGERSPRGYWDVLLSRSK